MPLSIKSHDVFTRREVQEALACVGAWNADRAMWRLRQRESYEGVLVQRDRRRTSHAWRPRTTARTPDQPLLPATKQRPGRNAGARPNGSISTVWIEQAGRRLWRRTEHLARRHAIRSRSSRSRTRDARSPRLRHSPAQRGRRHLHLRGLALGRAAPRVARRLPPTARPPAPPARFSGYAALVTRRDRLTPDSSLCVVQSAIDSARDDGQRRHYTRGAPHSPGGKSAIGTSRPARHGGDCGEGEARLAHDPWLCQLSVARRRRRPCAIFREGRRRSLRRHSRRGKSRSR